MNKKLEIPDVKEYRIKRSADKIIHYRGSFKIFILSHEDDKSIVKKIKNDLNDRNFIFLDDIAQLESYYNAKIDIINNVDYMVVIVSESFLLDWDKMEILKDNYLLNDNNDKIIPIIIQDTLYEPKRKSAIIKGKKEEIEEYEELYFDRNYNGQFAEELRRMQGILDVIKDFLNFSLSRDRKSRLSYSQKILRYLKHDRGIDINMEINNKKGNDQMQQSSTITNNFYAPIGNFQQGNNKRLKQVQEVVEKGFDYEQIKQIIDLINKENDELAMIYGDDVIRVREIISEITSLVEQKKEPQKIKKALLTLKDLSMGITGSLIASGIVSMISNLNL